jgi:opacity protein-like surface antigen
MNKLKNILIGLVTTISLTSVAYAGSFGLGVTGSYATIDASGSETAGDETTSSSVDNNAALGAVFVEYSLDDASWGSAGNGITIGLKHTPGSADVSDKVKSRTDTELSRTGTTTTTSTSRTQTAQAEIDNYNNFYIEVPLYKSLYVKAGMSSIDVTTKETTNGSNGGTYGNTSLDGTNLGIGVKGVTASNIIWKLAYEETNFDTLNLTSTTSNTIKADLDTKEVALSIGYRF